MIYTATCHYYREEEHPNSFIHIHICITLYEIIWHFHNQSRDGGFSFLKWWVFPPFHTPSAGAIFSRENPWVVRWGVKPQSCWGTGQELWHRDRWTRDYSALEKSARGLRLAPPEPCGVGRSCSAGRACYPFKCCLKKTQGFVVFLMDVRSWWNGEIA